MVCVYAKFDIKQKGADKALNGEKYFKQIMYSALPPLQFINQFINSEPSQPGETSKTWVPAESHFIIPKRGM